MSITHVRSTIRHADAPRSHLRSRAVAIALVVYFALVAAELTIAALAAPPFDPATQVYPST